MWSTAINGLGLAPTAAILIEHEVILRLPPGGVQVNSRKFLLMSVTCLWSASSDPTNVAKLQKRAFSGYKHTGTEIMVRAERAGATRTHARSAQARHTRGARRLDTAEQANQHNRSNADAASRCRAGCQSASGLLSSTSIHGASERRATIAFD